MKHLIDKKYPDELIIPTGIDDDKKIKNIIFITALLNGDYGALEILFTQPTTKVLETLTPRYKLNQEMQDNHLKLFPKKYVMEQVIAESAIPVFINFASNRISEQKKWLTIEMLIQHGAKPLNFLLNKNTSIEILEQIIKMRCNVNFSYHGFSALHAASISVTHRSEKLKLLIDHGADVNQTTTQPLSVGTPLHLLLANESISTSIEFITLAKDKINPNLKDAESKTPLLLAAKIRSSDAVKALLNNFKSKIDVNTVDKNQRTPLHFACAYGDIEMVKALIDAGANLNAKDHRGNTPLHYACTKQDPIRAMLESIEIHPDRDVNAIRNAVVDSTMTPILVNNKELLATKANIRDNIGALIKKVNTPQNPNREADTKLLSKQMNQLSGKSLIKTCIEGHQLTVNFLLERGVDILATNQNGNKASDIVQDSEIKKQLLVAEELVIKQKKIVENLTAFNFN